MTRVYDVKSLFNTRNLFPKRIQIQTINKCNGKCIICPYAYKEIEKTQYIDDTLFEKIVEETARDSPFGKVRISLMLQNEPFLDKRLVDRIRFVKKFNNLNVDTVTNGSLLGEKIIKELEESGIDFLTVSIDSVNKKTFEEVRQGLDFDRIMQNIELLRNSSLKDKVTIRMIAQKKNYSEIESFINFWTDKGLKVEIYGATNRGGALKNFEEIKLERELMELRLNRNIRPFYKSYKTLLLGFCTYPFFRFNILLNGDVLPCCHDWKHGFIMGNAKENTIKEIWHSDSFNRFRLLQLTRQKDKLDYCKNCSLIQ